jgi:hypothetical protein
MSKQGELFTHKASRHCALVGKRRSKPADFRARVRVVLEAFAPSAPVPIEAEMADALQFNDNVVSVGYLTRSPYRRIRKAEGGGAIKIAGVYLPKPGPYLPAYEIE